MVEIAVFNHGNKKAGYIFGVPRGLDRFQFDDVGGREQQGIRIGYCIQ